MFTLHKLSYNDNNEISKEMPILRDVGGYYKSLLIGRCVIKQCVMFYESATFWGKYIFSYRILVVTYKVTLKVA